MSAKHFLGASSADMRMQVFFIRVVVECRRGKSSMGLVERPGAEACGARREVSLDILDIASVRYRPITSRRHFYHSWKLCCSAIRSTTQYLPFHTSEKGTLPLSQGEVTTIASTVYVTVDLNHRSPCQVLNTSQQELLPKNHR